MEESQTQRVVEFEFEFDSVKAEKVNAMRRYRWRQNLRGILKACVPLAPLSYALSGNAARQLLSNVFNSNLCVFLLLNALVLLTFLLSGHKKVSGVAAAAGDESDLYGEYVAAVESRRRESSPAAGGIKESVVAMTPEDEVVVVAGVEFPAKTLSPVEEVSCENVDVESVPVCEDRAVTECETVIVTPSCAITKTICSFSGSEVEKVKRGGYRRTKSESFEKKRKEERKPEMNLKRSETARRSNLDDLTDEEFKRHCDRLSAFIRPIARS